MDAVSNSSKEHLLDVVQNHFMSQVLAILSIVLVFWVLIFLNIFYIVMSLEIISS